MSFARIRLRIGGSAALCVLVVFTACASKPLHPPVMPPPRLLPQDEPVRHALPLLLDEAHRAFEQGRYQAAAVFLKRFVERASDSPRLMEAHWWLGRAYEQLGDVASAIPEYRLVAGGTFSHQGEGRLYERRARQRLEDLSGGAVTRLYRFSPLLAVRLGVEHLPPITDLSPWFQEVGRSGVGVVAITPAMPGREGFGPELVQAIVKEAHRHGLLLWVAFDLHQGYGFDIRPEWTATARTLPGGDGTITATVDVANPAYQTYLEDTISLFVRAGCDGLLLLARSTPGFAEEFSSESLRAFAGSFRTIASPEEIFTSMEPSDRRESERSAPYWRWAGWKALSYAKLAARLHQTLRSLNPTAALLVEVHESTVHHPLEGLVRYGEDIVELAQRTGGLVMRREGESIEPALEKLGRLAGAEDHVWVGIALKARASSLTPADLSASAAGLDGQGRWNLLLDIEPGPSLP